MGAVVERRSGSSRRRVALALLVGAVGGTLLVPGVAAGAGASKSARSAFATFNKGVSKRIGAATRARARPHLRAVDLACLASFQFDFSPKLDNNTVSSQTTAALTGCLSPNGLHNDLLSAVLFADRGHSVATGCSPLPIAIDGVGSILWNDDSSSVFTFRVNTNPLAQAFGLEANITSGTLAGGRITALPAVVAQDGLCGLGGVRSLSVSFGTDIVTH